MAEVTTVSAVITAEADGAVSSLEKVTNELTAVAKGIKGVTTDLKNMGLDRAAKQFANIAKKANFGASIESTKKNILSLADAAEKAGDKTTAALLRSNADPAAYEKQQAIAEEFAEGEKLIAKLAEKAKVEAAKEAADKQKALVQETFEEYSTIADEIEDLLDEKAKKEEEAAKEAAEAAKIAAESEKAAREITNNAIIEDVRRREAVIAEIEKRRQANVVAQMKEKAAAEKQAAKDAVEAAKKAEKQMASARKTISGFSSGLEAPFKKIQNFFKAIGRIALYRAIRTAIKEISSAVKEGMTNLKAYSETVGTAFAPAVDTLRQHVMLLKNAFATALRPVIEALIPVIQRLVDWLAKAADFLAQVFSAMTGKVDENGRYTKAILGDLEQSNKQAKELRRTLLGFDEINRLDGDTGSGEAQSSGLMFEQAEISPKALETANKLQEIFGKIRNFINNVDWDRVIQFVAALLALKAIFKIVNVAKKVLSILKAVGAVLGGTGGILAIVAAIVLIFAIWGDKIAEFVATARDKVKGFFENVKEVIGSDSFIGGFIDIIASIIDLVLSLIQNVASAVYKLAHGDILGAINDILAFVSDLVNAVLNAVRWLWNEVLAPAINWLLTGLAKIGVWIYNALIDLRIWFNQALSWVWKEVIVPFLQDIVDDYNEIRVLFGKEPIKLNLDSAKFDKKITELENKKLPPINETVQFVGKWIAPANLKLHIDTSEAYQKLDLIQKKLYNVQHARGVIDEFAIRGYASGGFPARGSLFIAGEKSTEIVASFGGQTGVWNGDQMYSALYSAMTAALANAPQGGGDIYLDGEVIYRNVVNRNNNQVRSTGRAALLT